MLVFTGAGTSPDYQSEDAAQSRSGVLLPVLPGRGSDQPFRGLLASQLQCTKCAHKVSQHCPLRYCMCVNLLLACETNSQNN